MIIDPSQPETLKKFFEKYNGLNNAELATLAKRNTDTIRRWKRKCGITMKRHPFPKVVRTKVRTPIITDGWDSKEWFADQYSRHGMATIARLIGKSKIFVYSRMVKYGIKTKTFEEAVNSSNPCCTEEWLYYHYATKEDYVNWCKSKKIPISAQGGMGLTITECAKLAGTVTYTIMNWLAKFQMRIRKMPESWTISRNRCLDKSRTLQEKRRSRDIFFEIYRSGKVAIAFGKVRFVNGRRMDQTKAASQ